MDADTLPVEIADPRNPEHGDFACNFPLTAAKTLGLPPRVIADHLLAELINHDEFQSLEVAGPGFLNMRIKPAVFAHSVQEVLDLGPEMLPRSSLAKPLKINVEYVSVNPNGPITIGSGRGAAFGDAIATILDNAGHEVTREYYINDGVNSEQMRLFAESVKALAFGNPLPENGYKGDYVQDVADMVKPLIPAGTVPETLWFQEQSQSAMIERQRSDLASFGVHHDVWFSEQSLHDGGQVDTALKKLEELGGADRETYSLERIQEGKETKIVRKEETPGPLWMRSTNLGDDKDRVLVRADGRPAYLAADVAYMQNKLGTRGFDRAIMVLGPDHHGYIGRLNAACQLLGFKKEQLEVVIFQIVRFLKDGQPAPMRKRDGNIYELRDLIRELGDQVMPHLTEAERLQAGSDITRFFYLMRSHDSHMDFDIDLATKQGDENPVLYVQYAHARICSVLKKAEEAGFALSTDFPIEKLSHPKEISLIKKILDLPEEVSRCAEDFAVNRMTSYCVELARSYHHFYDECRVIQPSEPETTAARVALCKAAQIGIQASLGILGISAPERMERAPVTA